MPIKEPIQEPFYYDGDTVGNSPLRYPIERPWYRYSDQLADNILPTLNADFSNGRYSSALAPITVGNLFSVVRSTEATYIDANGALQVAPANTLRDADYSTGTRGALIEPSSSVCINNMMSGGGAGTRPTGWLNSLTQGGITKEILGVGTEDGFPYIDIKYSGTASITNPSLDFLTPITAMSGLVGEVFTASCYAKIVGGSLINVSAVSFRISEYDAASASLTSGDLSITPTSTRARHTGTRTNVNAACAYVRLGFRLLATNGATIDITLRLYAPQLEKLPHPTSVILSSSSTVAATRSSDNVTLNSSVFSSVYNQLEGTFVADLVQPYDDGVVKDIVSVSDTTLTNRMKIFSDNTGNDISWIGVVGGVTQTSGTSSKDTLTRIKTAMAYKKNDSSLVSGGAVYATDTSCTIPTVTRMEIGRNETSATNILNGVLYSLKYYPKRITTSELQRITT